MAHGLHLAVMDVLLAKNQDLEVNLDFEAMETVEEVGEEDDNDDDDDDGGVSFDRAYPVVINLAVEFSLNDIISKVRTTVKAFKVSPTRNDEFLQRYVVEEIGHRENLLLDCRTRWNSTLLMIQRFLKLRGPVQKALVDLAMDIQFTNVDFKILKSLTVILSRIEIAMKNLTSGNRNLKEAEAILAVLLDDFPRDDPLSKSFYEAVLRRVNERRGIPSKLIRFFMGEHRDLKGICHEEILTYLEKMNIDLPATSESLDDDLTQGDCNDGDDGFDVRMKKALEKANFVRPSPPTSLRNDFGTFLVNGQIGPVLQLHLDVLNSIQCTSTECERNFSLSTRFCTKFRSSLGDEALAALLFLKGYFIRNNK